jgi:hypothetical protein
VFPDFFPVHKAPSTGALCLAATQPCPVASTGESKAASTAEAMKAEVRRVTRAAAYNELKARHNRFNQRCEPVSQWGAKANLLS